MSRFATSPRRAAALILLAALSCSGCVAAAVAGAAVSTAGAAVGAAGSAAGAAIDVVTPGDDDDDD